MIKLQFGYNLKLKIKQTHKTTLISIEKYYFQKLRKAVCKSTLIDNIHCLSSPTYINQSVKTSNNHLPVIQSVQISNDHMLRRRHFIKKSFLSPRLCFRMLLPLKNCYIESRSTMNSCRQFGQRGDLKATASRLLRHKVLTASFSILQWK